jgi:hypothetical protein
VCAGVENGDNFVIDSNGQIYSDGYDSAYALGHASPGTGTVSSPGNVQTTFQPIDQPTGFIAHRRLSGRQRLQPHPGRARDRHHGRHPAGVHRRQPARLAPRRLEHRLQLRGQRAARPAILARPWRAVVAVDQLATGELSGTAPSGYGLALRDETRLAPRLRSTHRRSPRSQPFVGRLASHRFARRSGEPFSRKTNGIPSQSPRSANHDSAASIEHSRSQRASATASTKNTLVRAPTYAPARTAPATLRSSTPMTSVALSSSAAHSTWKGPPLTPRGPA